MLKEWPLVAFTILGQMAVGAFLFLFLLLVPAHLTGPAWTGAARRLVLAVLGLVLGAAGIAAALSFFHLRHPLRARRVLVNMRSSWLSREIFFELLFLGLVAFSIVLVWTGREGRPVFAAVMGGGAVTGLLFLVSMCKIYMLGSVPAWEPTYTAVTFFLTAGILGAMSTAWIAGAAAGDPQSELSTLSSLSLPMIAALLVFEAFHAPLYGLFGLRRRPSLRPPARGPRLLHYGKLVLLAGGMVLIAAGAGGSLTLALLSVTLGLAAGRFLFYGLVPRPGD